MTMAVALCTVLAFMTADASAAGSAYLGVKGGLNIATLSIDESVELLDSVFIEPDSRNGIAAGAFVGFQIAPNFIIQTEFLYSQKGAKYDTTLTLEGITGDVEIMLKFDYIEIPVLLKYAIPLQGNVRPTLFCGPALAIKSASKLKITASAMGQSASETIDIEEVKSTDFGLVFGGGIDIAAGRGKIVLDGRYTLGLSTVDDSPLNDDIKNRAFSVTAGYAFPIGN
jgi:opacity protein-like surface antigen